MEGKGEGSRSKRQVGKCHEAVRDKNFEGNGFQAVQSGRVRSRGVERNFEIRCVDEKRKQKHRPRQGNSERGTASHGSEKRRQSGGEHGERNDWKANKRGREFAFSPFG